MTPDRYSYARQCALGALLALAWVASMSFVGQMDYEDAIQEERHTCRMIEMGHWPVEVMPGCARYFEDDL